MNDKTNVVEIIPNDMPDWMIKAMAEGQLFNVVIARVNKLEDAMQAFIDSCGKNEIRYSVGSARMYKKFRKLLAQE